MAVTVTHQKTDTIADWNQEQLNYQISIGNYPSGTTLDDIVLPSDWNADHFIEGLGVEILDNSSSDALASGATFTGTAYDVSEYGSVVCAVKTDKDGTLYMEFSPDGTNWDSSLSFSVSASVNEVHRLSVTRKWFRVRFTNTGGSLQTYFRLQSLAGSQPILTSALNSTVQTDADAVLTRGILMGQMDNGGYQNVPVTPEGHLEVALHDPVLPFGSIHVENMTPIFQMDAVYGVNTEQWNATTILSGTATASDSCFTVGTGATQNGRGSLVTKKRLRYRAGQGFIGRYTAAFSAGVANGFQVAGFGHAEDGLFFGYFGTAYGIYYSQRGVVECRTLTISAGAATAGNATVTLNGTAFSVAVTNANNIYRLAYELASATYDGWVAQAVGATVVYQRVVAGAASGAYSLAVGTSSGLAGTFAQTKAGVSITTSFIPQASWNMDKMDGTGSSGVTIDPTKLNVYQIGMQYLGAGAIKFQIEVAPDGNNATWATVHVLQLPNTLTTSSFGNPSFPFTMSATNTGNSGTNLTIKTGSVGGFIEGQKVLTGNRYSYSNVLTTVGATNLQCLFTIANTRYFKGRLNQSVINILSVSNALKHTSPVIVYVIKGGTLAGNPNFAQVAGDVDSTALLDTSATTITGGRVVWSGHMGDTGEIDHHFGGAGYNAEEVTLQPGEWITLAAKAVTGTPSYVTGSINTREDQ
jgi:hypothetical protein